MSGAISATTIAYAALGTSIVGAGVGAAGSIMNGQNSAAAARAQASANYFNSMAQAQADDYRAAIDKANSVSTYQQTTAAEEQSRRQFNQLQGHAIAAAAQSGTDISSGSNLDILQQNAVMGELDALNIRYQGQTQARNYDAQSKLDKWNAKIDRINAQNGLATGNMTANAAQTAGYIGAGSSILSGVGSGLTSYGLLTK